MRTCGLWGMLALVSLGCGGSKETVKNEEGLPIWVDRCNIDLPATAICAVAESDFASADVEAAKTDAETAAKNRLADQIQAKNGRLVERLQSVMKDLTQGQIVGERTLKDINQNFNQQELRGIRYTDYFFHPSRVEPKKVWVRAVITVDSNKWSQDIVNAMMGGAAADRLELKHEEAQLRFDEVRKQYLAEEAAKDAGSKTP